MRVFMGFPDHPDGGSTSDSPPLHRSGPPATWLREHPRRTYSSLIMADFAIICETAIGEAQALPAGRLRALRLLAG
jgi:hypothetical protein